MASSSTRALSSVGSFLDLALESFEQTSIVQRDSALICQHAEHVTVGFVECAVEGIHVRVEVADDLVLRDERSDDCPPPSPPKSFGFLGFLGECRVAARGVSTAQSVCGGRGRGIS